MNISGMKLDLQRNYLKECMRMKHPTITSFDY